MGSVSLRRAPRQADGNDIVGKMKVAGRARVPPRRRQGQGPPHHGGDRHQRDPSGPGPRRPAARGAPRAARLTPLIVVISGPGGVGKGTIVERLLERDPRLGSAVRGRPARQRPGEPDDAYVFVTREAFEARIAAAASSSGPSSSATLRHPHPDRPAGGRRPARDRGPRRPQIRRQHPEALLIFVDAPSARSRSAPAGPGRPRRTGGRARLRKARGRGARRAGDRRRGRRERRPRGGGRAAARHHRQASAPAADQARASADPPGTLAPLRLGRGSPARRAGTGAPRPGPPVAILVRLPCPGRPTFPADRSLSWRVRRHDTMMNPPDRGAPRQGDSKFSLVTLAASRARQINSYFSQLGEGLGSIVPPQVTSVARKPLSIAFEEIAADKIAFERRSSRGRRGAVAVARGRRRRRSRPSRRRRVRRVAADDACWPGAASSSASPAGSPPTRRSRSAAGWSTPAPTSCPC